ncbi:MAG: hypothetical protein GXO82_05750 [Chlorobi bacterium]|nr:hypothetical protein [Chlorobiota bacterium]
MFVSSRQIPVFISLIVLFSAMTGWGQAGNAGVGNILALVNEGDFNSARQQAALLRESGVARDERLFVEALLESDAEKAVARYQTLVNSFPRSRWADDALFRLYQYYYAVGAYSTADTFLRQLGASYPNSPYVKGTFTSVADVFTRMTPVASPARISKKPGGTPIRAKVFTVQVASFRNRADAERAQRKYIGYGYSAYVAEGIVSGARVYRVRIGTFSDYEKANAFVKKLKQRHNLSAIVVNKD